MESWHSTQSNKYLALKKSRKSNGWTVALFTVEVGAMGHCSKSVLCCLKKLTFINTLVRNNIEKLSKSSMECSFAVLFCYFWLARNNKEWTPTIKLKVKDSLKETCNSPSPRPSLKQNIKPVSKANSICPVGFINTGKICYDNSILQVLSVIPSLCNLQLPKR